MLVSESYYGYVNVRFGSKADIIELVQIIPLSFHFAQITFINFSV